MSNGAECCALQICCPPAEQRAALVKIAVRDSGCTEAEAGKVIDALLPHFALAPKSFESVIADIVGRAKKHFTGSA